MGISYNDAELHELISKRTLSMLPKTCNICGSRLEFSDSLRVLHCVNKDCKGGILRRCLNFFKFHNIQVSIDSMLKIINKLNIVTPYQLIMIDEVYEDNICDLSDVQDIEKIIQIIKNIKQTEYFLDEVIEMCGIDEISTVARKVFHGFNSVEEIFEEIDSSRVIFFNERLGIRSSDSTIISVEIYNLFLTLREELIFAETQFKIKKHERVLRIAFSDNNIGRYLNKSEIIRYIEYTYSITILHLSSVNSATDILIRSGSSSNTKLRIARTINEKFIADSINNGVFELGDIGKDVAGQLKPIGSMIYIDSIDNILDKFDRLAGKL